MIPSSTQEITAGWLSHVLQIKPIKTITLNEVETKHGVLSETCKVHIQFERGGRVQNLFLFVKCLPSNVDLSIACQLFQTELAMLR